MVDESGNHGNNMMVVQFDFLFDAAIFRGTSTEMELQNSQFYCKKQIDNNFVLNEMKMRNCSIRYEALYKVSNLLSTIETKTRLVVLQNLNFPGARQH